MMEDKKSIEKNIGIVLLAAGESIRLGRPKQLLPYRKQTLLNHCLQIARTSDGNPIVVVLGAQAETIKKEISGNDAQIVVNADWEEGMASSIRCGIKELVRIDPLVEGALLMVCDQPHVTSSLINNLLTTHRKTRRPIIACSYAETFGPPVLFHKTLFPELLKLNGDVGARSVIQQHAEAVEVIPFPEGALDVDTEADYEKIISAGK
jgi:molybdenum cofactor cytidylyltransferase